MSSDNPYLVSSVRWAEKRYLWACHLYYNDGWSPVTDDDHDATERQLDLNRDLWSDYFKSHVEDPKKPLKPQAHALKPLSDQEKENAIIWAGYVEFVREHCK